MYVVSGSSDGTAQVWDASSGKRLLSTRSHINPAQSNDWAKVVAWSPTSKQILTGFQDGTAEALDINSRQRTAVYGGSTWGVDSANWSPDGKRVAVGRFDNTVEVYDAASGNLLHTYYTFPIFGVAWAPDDVRIVTGGYKKIAQVWKSDSGHTLLTYTKHTGGLVNAVAWSHHGSYIASGGNDVNTHIWEAQSGNLLHTYYTFPIFGVAWAPDDARIVTGGYKKIAQVWSVK